MKSSPTKDRFLAVFPVELRANRSVMQMAERCCAFCDADTLHSRLDTLVALFSWLREPDTDLPELPGSTISPAGASKPEWSRERVFVSVLEASEELRESHRANVAAILQETDGLTFFAQAGLPTDRGLSSEASERVIRLLLPAPREESDLSKLSIRLFPTQALVDRFFSMPAELNERLQDVLCPRAESPGWQAPREAMREAICLLAARIQGLGLSEKLRLRSNPGPVQHSPFYQLTRASDDLLTALAEQDSPSEPAQVWKGIVNECRKELQTIESHLDQRGVNLDVVYALDVIEKSLTRMEIIAGVLLAPAGQPTVVTAQRLLREVIRGRAGDRSLRQLASNNFRLLAKKIVEWAGKTGEHYITTDRREYSAMWRAALGGGLLTVGTAAIKMMVTHHGLPPFVEGFLAGLNYAVSFVLMQTFHLALATKQPSMTGAALAQIIHRRNEDSPNDPRKNDELVDFVARIVRSQLAAALGNIIAVSAGAVVFSLIWKMIFHAPFLEEETARYALTSLNPLRSGTVLFAALTGVILWLSSLAGGWIENWAVYHQLPKAIAEHRLGESFEPQTVRRVSTSIAQNLAAWGSSVVLGFMLGMTPEIGHFFGLPLDVRHVTLSSGTLALGATSMPWSSIGEGVFLMATLGIACTFVLNLSVSFYLALKLALRAQDATRGDYLDIIRTLRSRFLSAPRDFFAPPPRQREHTVEHLE